MELELLFSMGGLEFFDNGGFCDAYNTVCDLLKALRNYLKHLLKMCEFFNKILL